MLNRNLIKKKLKLDNQIKEKCGVIGIWCEKNLAAYYTRKGLYSLQHRGQESAGISIYHKEKGIITRKGMGLVPNVLTMQALNEIGDSASAIGQNRYSTTGSSDVSNAQPITLTSGKYQISIGHNGNIPDCNYLKKKIHSKIAEKETSDTHLVAQLLLQERPKYSSWDQTLIKVLPEVKGAFCFVIMTSDGSIYGARDPYGIRPFCLGKLENGWIIASESVAFDLTGAEFVRDIAPGEIIKISIKGEITSFFFGEPRRPQNCVLEYIYFSRPDSFENGIRVRSAREACGRMLGQRIKKKGIVADAVVPVFDSGYPAAKGVAKELGLPIIDAITSSHYVGRTFIQPGQANRRSAVSGKHNVVPDEIIGKKIIVVDDSIIRLTTSIQLNHILKESGAKKVYIASASPPVVDQCDLGIDMRSKKELPASQWKNESFETIEKNVADFIGADQVIYLPMDDLAKAVHRPKENFYYHPFGGPHPIRGQQHVFPQLKKKISGQPKICIFISGKGTFLPDIIEGINNREIDAKIISIVSNKKDAPGIKIAQAHNIPVEIIEYSGKLSDKISRENYDKKLFNYLKTAGPDLVLLSGWRLILGDTIIKGLQSLQIPVINHHPGLLTDNNSEMVATSRGIIPVMRGGNVTKETFDIKLHISGISVHQILPGNLYDVGPVIMKSEVRINPDDSFESWIKNMAASEHLLLPAALKRVIHVLKNNIDISTGNFYW